MNKKLIFHFIIYFISLASNASNFKPVITNFSTNNYGINAGAQNWGIAQGGNGEIYIANNKGMLIFDGYNWSMASIPGEMIIREIYADGDSLFVGSYEEFGYFKKNSFGKFEYHTLITELKNKNLKNEETWNIVRNKGKLYFQTFTSAFCYDGKHVTMISDKRLHPLYFHIIDGEIYAQLIDDGYYKFDGHNYHKIFNREKLNNDNVVAAISLSSNGGGKPKAILCTENSGLYKMDGQNLAPFPTAIDSRLKSSRVNRAIISKDSTIVIGTILDGIYAIDMNGNLKWHYNIESGLLNNSVLRLFCDRENNIWATLDNGIALIHTGSPFSIMIPERGESTLGMIYQLCISDNLMYIASNQGLYNYGLITGNIRYINESSGQNWHISKFGNQIFAGNNRATFVSDNGGEFKPIKGTTSSSTAMVQCNINNQDVLLESSYTNLRIYKKTENRWTLTNEVQGLVAPIKQIEVDYSGTIWASNMNKGVYKIELTNDLKHIHSIRMILKGEPNDTTSNLNYVMKVRGRIVLSDNKKLYTYNDIDHKIIPFTDLNDGLLYTSDIHSATQINDHTFCLTGKHGYTFVEFDGKKYHTIYYIPVSFFGLQNNESNDKAYLKDSIVYFNMNNGIAKLNIKDIIKQKYATTQRLILSKASTTSDDRTTIELPITHDGNVDVEGNISLIFSYPNYGSYPYSFKFILSSGSQKHITENHSPEISYHDLEWGSYKLIAQAVDPNGEIISQCEYKFRVPTPFFASVYAIILYIIISAIGIYVYSKLKTDKALKKKRKEYEAEKDRQNLKMMEQEKLIALQKQQLLEAELHAKSKELANLALDAVAKEKAIEGLKEAIYSHKLKGEVSQKDVENMLKRFDSDKNDSKFWEIYQNNFDLIHEHFFRNLRERYPKLTSSDLKFCALLRLNLSNKDIAKFTNLTIRGVETARYRIRKKLELSEKESLVEFLIDFK